MRAVVTLLAAFVFASSVAHAHVPDAPSPGAACHEGWYERTSFDGDLWRRKRIRPGDEPMLRVDALTVAGNHVMLEPDCPPAGLRLKTVRGTTVMKARWPDGCGAVTRPVKLRASLLFDGCSTVSVRVKAGRRRLHPQFRLQKRFCAEAGESAFELIQQRVFAPNGCALGDCHGAGRAGNLDLRPGTAHVDLVDVPARNAAAAAQGKHRVVPGHPEASFLIDKLAGHLGEGEGERMPLGTAPLTPNQLGLVKSWILAGAPATGAIAAAPCLPIGVYEPAQPLAPPPPGGHQLLLEGPLLQPGQEEEGCMWVRAPNDEDMYVSGWEFALNPGTHHFAVVPPSNAEPPPTGIWHSGLIACGTSFGQQLAGSPQAPYYEQRHPPGVATLIPGGSHLGLNAHYYNEFDVPIRIKVWINLVPYEGEPAYVAHSFASLDSTFSIAVPPFTQKIHAGRFENTSAHPWRIFGIAGHMHKRGLRFTAWLSDGTKAYETFDWSHPGSRDFDPPLLLEPGDYVDYECLHDNGVERPVRRREEGIPATVVFGVSAEDEMCILTGSRATE